MWLGGMQPSSEDAEKFDGLGGVEPNADTHPQAYGWYGLVSRFTEAVRKSWGAAAPASSTGGKKGGKGGKKAAPKKEAKAAAAEPEVDLDDLFDADPAADEAAAAEMKKKAEENKAKKKKAAPVAKSLIVWEVKPWGEDTDL